MPVENYDRSSPLLDLPPELRNRIWETLFSEPSEWTIDKYVHQSRKHNDKEILSVSRVNHQLRRECLPFYWSCTVFRILHRGHRDDSGFDEYFYKWLQRLKEDDINHIRRLELKIRLPYVLPKSGSSMDPSVAIINIDLDYPCLDDAISVQGYYRTCPLAIIHWVRKAVLKVSRVDRKPIVSREVLWDIYESCYLLTRSDSRERRTWADFERAYELNQSKARPMPWSENVYYEMSQEAIHGPGWQEREVEKKRNVKIAWECR